MEAVEPPALLAATAFSWHPASDTGEVHTFCGIDFQSRAGWVLFAIAASGETVFMEADRTYIANYNASVEPAGSETASGESPATDCEADRGCGAATAASLGILLMSAARPRESPPSHVGPGTGPCDSP